MNVYVELGQPRTKWSRFGWKYWYEVVFIDSGTSSSHCSSLPDPSQGTVFNFTNRFVISTFPLWRKDNFGHVPMKRLPLKFADKRAHSLCASSGSKLHWKGGKSTAHWTYKSNLVLNIICCMSSRQLDGQTYVFRSRPSISGEEPCFIIQQWNQASITRSENWIPTQPTCLWSIKTPRPPGHLRRPPGRTNDDWRTTRLGSQLLLTILGRGRAKSAD